MCIEKKNLTLDIFLLFHSICRLRVKDPDAILRDGQHSARVSWISLIFFIVSSHIIVQALKKKLKMFRSLSLQIGWWKQNEGERRKWKTDGEYALECLH